jgi:SHS2 domain-containing protein
MESAFGFRELSHTADWELEVWAPDLSSLLEQATRGMYALSGLKLDASSPVERSLAIHAEDAEGILVRFLTELLWLGQEESLAFDHFSINISPDWNLWADLRGGLITGLDKEIKAVTYHNLKVKSTPNGFNVTIVFDV